MKGQLLKISQDHYFLDFVQFTIRKYHHFTSRMG